MPGLFAFAFAAIFTGAAFYISVAEQPARLRLSNEALLAEWQIAYPRGMAMQGGLAVAGFLAGGLAWWVDGLWLWAAGGLLMIANWPYTFGVIMPLNRSLMDMPAEAATGATRDDIVRWDRLHRVRTALGAAATVAFGLAISAGR